MIIQYYRVDGTMKVERTKLNARYIEMPDGAHPVTHDSVYQDDKRTRQPILCIFEGVTPPLGADMTEEDLSSMMTEIELIKLSYKKPSFSKLWMRLFSQAFEWLFKRGAPIALFGFIAFVVMDSYFGGA